MHGVEQPAHQSSPTEGVFLADEANRAVAEGRGPYRPEGALLASVMGGVFLVAGVLFLVGLASLTVRAARLRYRQEAATGKLVEAWSGRTRHGPTATVEYEFEAEGKTWRGKQSVPPGWVGSSPKGRPVSVRYVRGDPEVSELTGTQPGQEESGALAIFGGALCFALVPLAVALVGVGLLTFGARLRRLRRGAVLPVTFFSSRVVPGSRGTWRLEVEYRFRSPTGRTIAARDDSISTQPEGGRAPQPGQAARIIYVSDRLYRLL